MWESPEYCGVVPYQQDRRLDSILARTNLLLISPNIPNITELKTLIGYYEKWTDTLTQNLRKNFAAKVKNIHSAFETGFFMTQGSPLNKKTVSQFRKNEAYYQSSSKFVKT